MSEEIQAIVNSLPIIDTSNPDSIYQINNNVQSGSNIFKVVEKDGEVKIAVALSIPRDHPAALDYLKEVRDYNDTNKDIYDQIALSRKLYLYEPVVGTVIDLFSDFSHSKFKVENVKNKDAKKLIEYFMANVNKNNNNMPIGIDALGRYFSLEFYIAGNVFAFSNWKNTYIEELKKEAKLPISIVNIDPMILEIPEESVQFGNKRIVISYSRLFGRKGRFFSKKDKMTALDNFPTKIRHKLSNSEEYELDPYYVYHIKRKGNAYSGWGKPYLTRSFTAVAQKRRLRALDESTIEGLINSVTIFKIGDPNVKETWSPSRISAFRALMNNPAATMQLVTAWDVEVEHIGPKGDILQFSDRYKDANNDILYALGVPGAILTGEGNRAGDVWASIRFLIERLEESREEHKLFIEDIIKKILEENGYKDEKPRIRYYKPGANKEDIKNIILALYDRGLLSSTTTLEEAGFNSDEESERRKEEKDTGKDDMLKVRELPYSPKPNPQTNTQSPDKTNKKKPTKISEVNNKGKKVTPRLEGMIKEIALEAMYQNDFDKTKTMDVIKENSTELMNLVIAETNTEISEEEFHTKVHNILYNKEVTNAI